MIDLEKVEHTKTVKNPKEKTKEYIISLLVAPLLSAIIYQIVGRTFQEKTKKKPMSKEEVLNRMQEIIEGQR